MIQALFFLHDKEESPNLHNCEHVNTLNMLTNTGHPRYLTYRPPTFASSHGSHQVWGEWQQANLPWHDSQHKRWLVAAKLWISWSIHNFTANHLSHANWSMWTEKNVYLAWPFFIWRTGVQDYTTLRILVHHKLLITFIFLRSQRTGHPPSRDHTVSNQVWGGMTISPISHDMIHKTNGN